MKENKSLIFDIYEKVTGKSDMDWADICTSNNLECHPDTLRKAGVGIKMAAEAGVLNFEKACVREQDELYKAKRQFYDQRREYNKLLIEDARQEHLDNELIRCAERMNIEKCLMPIKMSSYYNPASVNEAVLVLSDWHFGLTADNVWNEYNPEIADRRISYMRDKVIEKMENNAVNVLHVVILGDMISGSIHTSIRVKNNEGAVDQIMSVSERLAELISDLANRCSYTRVYCTYGNHARVTANLNDSIHNDNMERIIPFWLKQRLKDRTDISVCNESAYELLSIKIGDSDICAVHGDLDVGKNNAMLTLSILYEKNYGAKMNYLIMGHWHTTYTDENLGIKQIGVGSLCGTDEYAKNKRLFSNPSQTLLIFDKHGLDSIHDIDLTHC